jgi:hypothetical protein
MATTSGVSIYTVRRGDTLTKIAKAYNTTPQEIARRNHISNINYIKVGDHLFLQPDTPKNQIPPKTDNDESYVDNDCDLYCKIVDAIERPIAKLKVWIKAGEEIFEHLTDSRGEIPPVQVKKGTRIEVDVKKAAGGKKTVSSFEANDNMGALLRSPKVAAKATQKSKGNPPKKPDSGKTQQTPQPGDVINSHTNDGLLQQIVCECPNKENLRLGKNFKYRKILLDARDRTGIDVLAVACLIDAEASRIVKRFRKQVLDKQGNPVIDKKTGKPKTKPAIDDTEWNPKSRSPRSSATGLTQFTDETWIDMALTNGTFLNNWVNGKGWLTTKTVKEGRTERTVQAFKLSNGTHVTPKKIRKGYSTLAKTLSIRPHITGKRMASDKNLQEILDLRYEPEYAIHTAMDFAVANMKNLRNHGFTKIDGLNPGEKAKILYLAHHLGGSNAPRFINDVIDAERAEDLLRGQYKDQTEPEKKAKDAGGNWVKAHREWLEKYVEDRIRLENHMCENRENITVRKLLAITESIKRGK